MLINISISVILNEQFLGSQVSLTIGFRRGPNLSGFSDVGSFVKLVIVVVLRCDKYFEHILLLFYHLIKAIRDSIGFCGNYRH